MRTIAGSLFSLLLLLHGAAASDTPEKAEFSYWTEWLTDGDGPGEYHDVWLRMSRRGFYPVWIEGRTVGDHSEYRAIFLPRPEPPNSVLSYHGIDIEGYMEGVQEFYGYRIASWHWFFDHHGELRFSVTWLKTREAFRLDPTRADGNGGRVTIDLSRYPDLQR